MMGLECGVCEVDMRSPMIGTCDLPDCPHRAAADPAPELLTREDALHGIRAYDDQRGSTWRMYQTMLAAYDDSGRLWRDVAADLSAKLKAAERERDDWRERATKAGERLCASDPETDNPQPHIPFDHPIRESGVAAADIFYRGSPNMRLAFNHGVKWAATSLLSERDRATDRAAKLEAAERKADTWKRQAYYLENQLNDAVKRADRAEAALAEARAAGAEAMREAAAKFIEEQADRYVSYQAIWRFADGITDGIRALSLPATKPEGE